MGTLPEPEYTDMVNFFEWADETGFFNKTLQLCADIANSETEFMSRINKQIIYFVSTLNLLLKKTQQTLNILI